MISRLGLAISAIFRRTCPDPFVLAVLLTVVTLVLALVRTDSTMSDLVAWWAGSRPGDTEGVWSLLAFGMQMCLILVTGHALASSPPVSALLHRLAGVPRTGAQAAALVAFVAALTGVLNWGLGLIVGAILARRVGMTLAQRNIKVHYPLVAAAGYVGMMIWHGGFSGSAPLKVTTPQQITDIFGDEAPYETISLTETIFSPMNIVITGGLLLISPALLALMMPRDEKDIQPIERFVSIDQEPDSEPATSTAAKPFIPRLLEDTPLVTVLLIALIAWWALSYYFPHFYEHTLLGKPASEPSPPSGITRLTPDTVNMTMLMLGMALHGTPARYVRAINDAAHSCGAIILQFPLYAGIMGVMKASGLTAQLSHTIANTSNETTLPLFTFIAACIINLFVPSGGGQWAVQGEIALQAGLNAGVDPGKMVMAVAYGDELTNMLQPFWALPLLAITGVKARDIVGYTAILMIVAGLWMAAMLLVF